MWACKNYDGDVQSDILAQGEIFGKQHDCCFLGEIMLLQNTETYKHMRCLPVFFQQM